MLKFWFIIFISTKTLAMEPSSSETENGCSPVIKRTITATVISGVIGTLMIIHAAASAAPECLSSDYSWCCNTEACQSTACQILPSGGIHLCRLVAICFVGGYDSALHLPPPVDLCTKNFTQLGTASLIFSGVLVAGLLYVFVFKIYCQVRCQTTQVTSSLDLLCHLQPPPSKPLI